MDKWNFERSSLYGHTWSSFAFQVKNSCSSLWNRQNAINWIRNINRKRWKTLLKPLCPLDGILGVSSSYNFSWWFNCWHKCLEGLLSTTWILQQNWVLDANFKNRWRFWAKSRRGLKRNGGYYWRIMIDWKLFKIKNTWNE